MRLGGQSMCGRYVAREVLESLIDDSFCCGLRLIIYSVYSYVLVGSYTVTGEKPFVR
jgi:hypothetical protein